MQYVHVDGRTILCRTNFDVDVTNAEDLPELRMVGGEDTSVHPSDLHSFRLPMVCYIALCIFVDKLLN